MNIYHFGMCNIVCVTLKQIPFKCCTYLMKTSIRKIKLTSNNEIIYVKKMYKLAHIVSLIVNLLLGTHS